ncbi:MAG TPA: hypothetical protein VFK76_12785 [Gaiellaceae bacterium]|nr:hypothetical protein [Gaiellaceae bacterium]
MSLDDSEFESLLDQVRELHRLADELTRSSRLQEHVRARLEWSHDTPSLPIEQARIAEEVVEALETPRLSRSQSRQLYRAFFGR